MARSEYEKRISQRIPEHTHKYIATTITGTDGQGKIYLCCEDGCPVGSSITFPLNPRKHYGEQIAREIEEHGNSWLGPNGDGIVLHSKESAAIYAAVARGK